MDQKSSLTAAVHVARREAHGELQAVTGGLIAEFAGHVPAGTVIAHVARAREQLLSTGMRSGLVPATESMARARLRQLLPVHAGQ